MKVSLGVLRELISEKIRDGGKQKFNLKEFEALTETWLRRDYCDDRLQLLGEGSTRKVYVLTSKTALKLATNHQGFGQNAGEVMLSEDPTCAPIVARVLRHADDNSWVVSELVKPVGDNTMQFNRQFDDEFGAPPDAEDPLLKQMLLSDEKDLEQFYFRGPVPEKTLAFMRAFQEVVNKHNVEFSDATKASSWGRAPDGRLVMLDYGFVGAIIKSHYGKGK